MNTTSYHSENIKEELCIVDTNHPLTNSTIKAFTEDINIADYVICKHGKGRICKCGISFGNEIFCKSRLINELIKQHS